MAWQSMKPTQTHWRWFFLLAALSAGAAFVALIFVPREGNGFSLSRLALLSILFSFCILWIYFAVRLPGGLDRFARPSVILITSLLSLTLAGSLFFLRYLSPERSLPYFQRLSPLLFHLLTVCLLSSFFSFILGFIGKIFCNARRSCNLLSLLSASCFLYLSLSPSLASA